MQSFIVHDRLLEIILTRRNSAHSPAISKVMLLVAILKVGPTSSVVLNFCFSPFGRPATAQTRRNPFLPATATAFGWFRCKTNPLICPYITVSYPPFIFNLCSVGKDVFLRVLVMSQNMLEHLHVFSSFTCVGCDDFS